MSVHCEPTDIPPLDDIDVPAVQVKYAIERDRRIRSEAQEQYVSPQGRFADISENAQVFFDISELDAAARKRLRQASPITYVRKGLPPHLFIHGTKDPTVPFEQSPRMCDALKKAGNTCEVFPVEGGGHGIGGWEKNPEMLAYKTKMVEWLQATLK